MNAGARSYDSKIVYKKIRLRPQFPEEAKKISSEFQISELAANVLSSRGYKADKDLQNYIQPSLRDGLLEPDKLKNLKEAAKLISETIRAKRSIAICCDFDVDGLTGGAQLHHFLNEVGVENQVFVPDRFKDGYGLNEKTIKKIALANFGLVICIDYGTTNISELNLARELGLKSIVVDHHQVGEHVPSCDVFINPNQKGCKFADSALCASGLTWYLILALKKELPEAEKIDPKLYLDLACLGTICDMVPLKNTNRIIAKRGLELMSKTTRPGLQALKNVAGLNGNLSCSDVSFGIGPRINAAGRLVHGEMVVELLSTNDTKRSQKIAEQLNKLNTERQQIENRVKDKALYLVNSLGNLPFGLVVHDPQFHTGVIGIVAQRLVENFYRPSVVLGMDEEGIYKGSVRGIKGFSVVDTLASLSEYFIKFGGHDGAGGLSIESSKVDAFTEAFAKECEKRLSKIDAEPFVEADTTAYIGGLDLSVVRQLKSFAPFGIGNPNPVLLAQNLWVKDVRLIKNAHLKVLFSDGKNFLNAFSWRQKEHPELFKGNKVNVAFRAEENTFNGNTDLQATIQAVERA